MSVFRVTLESRLLPFERPVAPVDDGDVTLDIVGALEGRRREQPRDGAPVGARPEHEEVLSRRGVGEELLDRAVCDAGLDVRRTGGVNRLGAARVEQPAGRLDGEPATRRADGQPRDEPQRRRVAFFGMGEQEIRPGGQRRKEQKERFVAFEMSVTRPTSRGTNSTTDRWMRLRVLSSQRRNSCNSRRSNRRERAATARQYARTSYRIRTTRRSDGKPFLNSSRPRPTVGPWSGTIRSPGRPTAR